MLKWTLIIQKSSSKVLSYQDPVKSFEVCLTYFRKHFRNPLVPGVVPGLITSTLGWAGYLEVLTSEDIETINETFEEGIEAETLFILLCLVEELYHG